MFNGTWPSSQRRSTAFSQQGMAASASPNAALVGARTLGDGGTAFDAALSMALVEGVALPRACGLGGDTFCLLYHAATGQFRAVSGSGAAPSRATAELFRGQGLRVMPGDGPLSTSVPGALDAYLLLHENYGSRSWGDLIQPAIDLADRGLVVTPRLAYYLQVGKSRLEPFPCFGSSCTMRRWSLRSSTDAAAARCRLGTRRGPAPRRPSVDLSIGYPVV